MHSSSLPVSMTVQSSAVRVLLFAVLALTVSLRTAKAQNPTRSPTRAPSTPEPTVVGWGGCVDPDGSNKKVTIGEKTTVCLQLGNGNNWAAGTEYIRLAFQPKADEYTRFFVPQSYSELAGDALASGSPFSNKNITAGVASQTELSYLRQYFDHDNGKIYPFLTAIIDVNGGVVEGITWDDSCVFCGSDVCEENTYDFNGNAQTQQSSGQPSKGCYVSETACTNDDIKQTEDQTECDLTLYVVWTGTDSDGKTFQSAANRFSQFPAQELQNRLVENLPKVAQDLANREL